MTGATATSGHPPSDIAAGLPLWRLHAMRVGYAFMGIGLVVVKWPLVITYDQSMPLYEEWSPSS